MKPHIRLFLLLLVGMCCSCSSKPSTLIESGYDEKEMDAAIARARSEVDSFIAEMTKGNGTDFAVKAPIEDKGETEHFWLTDVVYRDGEFAGKIGNEPGSVGKVKLGQPWTIKKEQISDWLFMRDGKMHGNYTLRPLLKTMPENEAAKLRSMLANP
ncbi:MAG: YegJ family protein [Pirellulaceae bacterium]